VIHHCSFGHGRTLVALLASVGAVLVASFSVAPAAGARETPAARTWSVESSPNPSGASASGLSAVSCSGPGSCVAVGAGDYPSGHQIRYALALIEQLSSDKWTVASTPTLPGATASPLVGVSCPLANFCAAVGYVQYAHPGIFDALVETWNGKSWKADSIKAPTGGSDPSLAAVSCAAKGSCLAVGNYIDSKSDSYRTLAERLDGTAWSVVPSPDPHGASGNSEFSGVDCVTPNLCESVGNVAYNDTLQKVFAYSLNGSTWTPQRQVNPTQTPGNTDEAVSCSTSDACTSVGFVYVVREIALAEYWNGSKWTRQRVPAPPNRPETILGDVSCVGNTSCVSVGTSAGVNPKNGHLRPAHVMAEVWNGTSWSLSEPVGAMGTTVGLTGISCTSRTTCIAVGGSATESGEGTLVEAYTG
jgi:hypothetical protein